MAQDHKTQDHRAQDIVREKRYFLVIIGVSMALLAGVITENVFSVIRPKTIQIVIDVEKVRKGIIDAGLKPREASYWKEIK